MTQFPDESVQCMLKTLPSKRKYHFRVTSTAAVYIERGDTSAACNKHGTINIGYVSKARVRISRVFRSRIVAAVRHLQIRFLITSQRSVSPET